MADRIRRDTELLLHRHTSLLHCFLPRSHLPSNSFPILMHMHLQPKRPPANNQADPWVERRYSRHPVSPTLQQQHAGNTTSRTLSGPMQCRKIFNLQRASPCKPTSPNPSRTSAVVHGTRRRLSAMSSLPGASSAYKESTQAEGIVYTLRFP